MAMKATTCKCFVALVMLDILDVEKCGGKEVKQGDAFEGGQ